MLLEWILQSVTDQSEVVQYRKPPRTSLHYIIQVNVVVSWQNILFCFHPEYM